MSTSKRPRGFFANLKCILTGYPDAPDLAFKQRAARPVINFLVERYFPKRCFYGDDFLSAFDQYDDTSAGRMAAKYMMLIIHDANQKGDDIRSITWTFEDVTLNDTNIGSYTIGVQRIDGARAADGEPGKAPAAKTPDPRLVKLDRSAPQ